MSIELKVYDNGDHTCLVWLPTGAKPIPNCRGFVIRCTYPGTRHADRYIHGFVGFTDDAKPTSGVESTALKFPLQRFLWWDYGVRPGDTVQYQVLPVIGSDQNSLKFDGANASPTTDKMTISGQCTPQISAYFNKGIVAAQWVSRGLNSAGPNEKLKDVVAKVGNPLREELSGLLRPQILSLLADVKKNNGKIYAALYELNDPELIPALVALGQNCNLILANGAFKGNTPPDNDENKDVRANLRKKINLIDRIVPFGHFGHNKFVVFCDSAGKPQSVLTGSTNWTTSGLCTQANNAIVINDSNVAADYLEYWQRIKAAGNAYPADYVTANSTATTYQVDGCKVTPWCVPTKKAQDLDYARKLISAAKEGILFLFFNPGVFEPSTKPEQWTLLQNVLTRHQPGSPDFNPNLYIRGVVNQEIPQLTEPARPPKGGASVPQPVLDPSTPSPVTLFTGGNKAPQNLGHDVLVPRNIKAVFHEFEKEQLGANMVNIHSKVIVLDPFGANPVVMTGSHNLGFKASSKNDDNLIIVEGNAPLAAAYAINIIAVFDNYRWNSYVEAHRSDPKVWHALQDSDQWQVGHLSGDSLAELEFWLGKNSQAATSQPGKSTASTPPSSEPSQLVHPVHAVSTHSGNGSPEPGHRRGKHVTRKKRAGKKLPRAKHTRRHVLRK